MRKLKWDIPHSASSRIPFSQDQFLGKQTKSLSEVKRTQSGHGFTLGSRQGLVHLLIHISIGEASIVISSRNV
eukprot:10109718-Prorocentrum_lima.AAC.1